MRRAWLCILFVPLLGAAPTEDITSKVIERDTKGTGKKDYREVSTFRNGVLAHKLCQKDADLNGDFEVWSEELCVEGKTVIKIIKFPNDAPFRSVKWNGEIEIMETAPTASGLYESVTLSPKDVNLTEEFQLHDGHYLPVAEAQRLKSIQQIIFGRKIADQIRAGQAGKMAKGEEQDSK